MIYLDLQIIFLGVCLGLTIGLLYLLSCLWPPDSPWSPWWKTEKNAAEVIVKLASITAKDKVYELGSGDGEFLLYIADKYKIKGIGVEIDPLRVLISKVRARLLGISHLVVFKKKNFFEEDISKADVVFLYLVPRVLREMLPKLKKELKKGTRVISYRYQMDLPLKKKTHATTGKKHSQYSIYLYQI